MHLLTPDSFARRLAACGLFDPADPAARPEPGADPADQAARLVAAGALTPFQARRLLEADARLVVGGRYALLDRLGRGGGEAYLCEHLALRHRVELHLVAADRLSDPASAARLRSAGRVAVALAHPNVARVLELDRDGEATYLVSEHADGPTLAELRARGPLPAARAAEYAAQAASGLGAVHAAGLAHGGVGLAALTVTRAPGGAEVVKLTGLGLSLVGVGSGGGQAADLVALGRTLRELLDLADAPPGVLAVADALAGGRFRDAREAAEALAPYRAGWRPEPAPAAAPAGVWADVAAPESRPLSALSTARAPARRPPVLALSLGASALAAAALAFALVPATERSAPTPPVAKADDAPPEPPPTDYEAEDARLTGGRADTKRPGFRGSGYANLPGPDEPGAVEFPEVRVARAGLYRLHFRYLNASQGDRPLDLTVNGTRAQGRVSFLPATEWAESAAAARLRQGPNLVRLATTDAGGPEIDRLSVEEVAPGSAAFVAVDSATAGQWESRYGADGWAIAGHSARPPAYATMVAERYEDHVWKDKAGDCRGPRRGPGTSERVSAGWYNGTDFDVIVTVAGGPRRLALYCVDWDGDGGGRRQSVRPYDAATGTPLAPLKVLENFGAGRYLVYDVSGGVRFRFTSLNKRTNAVLCAAFFGGPADPAATHVLLNRGFEDGHAAWRVWHGPDGNGRDASHVRDAADSRSGRRHGRHEKAGPYIVYTSQSLHGIANGVYHLSAWYRSSGGQRDAWFEAKEFGGDKRVVDVKEARAGWTRIEIRDIRVTNSNMEVGFLSDAAAGQWLDFDDFELVRVGD